MLDTSAAVAVLRGLGDAPGKFGRSESVLLAAPVLAELLYGADRSARPEENEELVLDLARTMEFIACDEAVCRRYAALKASLARAGRPIPDNDLWVAACCLAAGATLVTRDAHFQHVPDLVCEEW